MFGFTYFLHYIFIYDFRFIYFVKLIAFHDNFFCFYAVFSFIYFPSQSVCPSFMSLYILQIYLFFPSIYTFNIFLCSIIYLVALTYALVHLCHRVVTISKCVSAFLKIYIWICACVLIDLFLFGKWKSWISTTSYPISNGCLLNIPFNPCSRSLAMRVRWKFHSLTMKEYCYRCKILHALNSTLLIHNDIVSIQINSYLSVQTRLKST